MDANQTRFHALIGPDWQRLLADSRSRADGLVWDAERSALTLEPDLPRLEPAASPLQRPRGHARDRYGNWYWIADSGREILRLRPGEKTPETYWPVAPVPAPPGLFSPAAQPLQAAPRLQGLAVTARDYLVAGLTDAPGGVLAFDLHGNALPIEQYWPDHPEVAMKPLDMSPAPDGGLFILDDDGRRYWVLDQNLSVVDTEQRSVRVEPARDQFFRPLGAGTARREATSFPTGIRPALPAQRRLIAIEAAPDGSVLLLDDGKGSTVYRDRMGHSLGLIRLAAGQRAIGAYDITCRSDPERQGSAVLYALHTSGKRVLAFSLPAGTLISAHYPVYGCGFRGLFAADDGVWYDRESQWLPLAEHPVRRCLIGGLTTTALDSGIRGCVWHRVVIDAVVPQGAALAIESRAADDPGELEAAPWRPEPAPYHRNGGSELPYHRPFTPSAERDEGAGTWELLLQQATGRYLQLRLGLRGTGRNSPRVAALRVYYPRFSYLERYLPEVYRRDPVSASFLERFLANPEGILTALEDRIAEAQYLLDPDTTPGEYLPWLAGWLGVMFDANWDESRQRLFVRRAHELFGQRGTVPGLIRALRLAIDPSPDDTLFTEDPADADARFSVRIVERFRYRKVAGSVMHQAHAGAESVDTQVAVSGAAAHRFLVLLPWASAGGAIGNLDPRLVERIVALERPAHTQFEVREYWAAFRVGEARLGSETLIGPGLTLPEITLGKGYIGQALLALPYPWNLSGRAVVGRIPVAPHSSRQDCLAKEGRL